MSLVRLLNDQLAIELNSDHPMYGWLFQRHPDGQWVTVRLARAEEIEEARLLETTGGPK